MNDHENTAGLQDHYQMNVKLELFRTLTEAEEDVRADRIASVQNTFDDIRKTLRGEEN